MEDALGKGCPEIFNSDQGSQFASSDFTGMLVSKEIAISMDGRGQIFDNIFTERLWRSVKYEEVYIKDYQVCRDAREGLEAYFHFITIGGIIKRWNIKHRMRFIMEFLVGISKGRIAMSKDGLRGVQKGNSSRPTGPSVTLLNIVIMNNASKY